MSEYTVLIFDNDTAAVEYCRSVLSQASFGVKSANTPPEALVILEKDRIDVLIAALDGSEDELVAFVHQARKKNLLLPVVVLAGSGQFRPALKGLRKGIDGLLIKPLDDPGEILETVQYALRQRDLRRRMDEVNNIHPMFEFGQNMLPETIPDELGNRVLQVFLKMLQASYGGIFVNQNKSSGWRIFSECGPEQFAGLDEPGLNKILDSTRDLGQKVVFGPPQNNPLFENWLAEKGLKPVFVPSTWQEHDYIFFALRSAELPAMGEADVQDLSRLVNHSVIALDYMQKNADLRTNINHLEESKKLAVLSEKMDALGRLISTVAHEVNNPLQSITNCLHLASRTDVSEERKQGYIQLALGEVDRLSNLVQSALHFYRPNLVQESQIDLADLFETVLGLLEPQLLSQDITVHRNYGSGCYPVKGIAASLQQVFLNILLNAIQAVQTTPAPHEIWIDLARAETTTQVRIEDSGPGLNPVAQKRVFEPFFTTKSNGTGLGLSISYEIIVDVHRGEMGFVEGAHGKGACISISLRE